MKKRDIFDNLLRYSFVLGMTILGLAIIYMFSYLGKDEAQIVNSGTVTILDSWEFTDRDGNTQMYKVPYSFDIEGMDSQSFTTKLPDAILPGSVFAILNRSDVKMFIDDSLIYQWKKGEASILGGPPKNSYMFIELKPEYAGKKLTMLKEDPEFSGNLFPGYVGEKDAVIWYLTMDSNLIQFALSMFLLLLSLMVVITSIVLKRIYKQEINLVFGAMGIFVSACWLTVDSFCFQFMTRTRFIDGFMSYICTMSIIFPFIVYLNRIQSRRYKKVYAYIALGEIVSMVIFTTLHVTGTKSFSQLLAPIDIVLGIGVLITFIVTLRDLKNPESKSYRTISIGFLLFMISTILEILLINFDITRTEGTSLLVGLYILFVFALIQQIIEINLVQKERNEANEIALARTRFLANMSHEIRTPINSILGMNEMILKENDNPTIANYAKVISESGTILLALVNDVLDFSKIQSGMSEIRNHIYNPRVVHDKICNIAKERAKAKGLEIKIGALTGFPETLYGDGRHIAQVLLNLLSNAIKYTEKGCVTFTSEFRQSEDNCQVIFHVSDTGKGIKSEDLESIFNPFVRKNLKENRNIQGTGLGLSITKQLVELMGGTITVDSVPGKGSTFCVKIPQEITEGQSAEDIEIQDDMFLTVFDDEYDGRIAEISEEAASLRGIDENYIAPEARVLVTDDVPSNLIVVKEFLKDTQIILDTAESGREAIKKCKIYTYDVILMDHMMPEPDGIATMHMIREDKESLNRNTPMIILTANAIKGSRDMYFAEGFDNYLSKPVQSSNLLKMVRKYLPQGKVMYKPKSRKPKSDSKDNMKINKSAPTKANIPDGPLDIKQLYERFENRESTINVILTEIVKEGRRKIVLLRELFEKGDIGNYAIEAHGVKGVMASSCAQEFSDVAKAHEMAAKEGRVDFIADNIDSFLKQYGEVLEFVVEYLKTKGITVEEEVQVDLSDPAKASESDLINAALSALNDFDVEKTLEILNNLKNVAGKEKSGTIEEIIAYTDAFDYDKATKELNRLKSEVN